MSRAPMRPLTLPNRVDAYFYVLHAPKGEDLATDFVSVEEPGWWMDALVDDLNDSLSSSFSTANLTRPPSRERYVANNTRFTISVLHDPAVRVTVLPGLQQVAGVSAVVVRANGLAGVLAAEHTAGRIAAKLRDKGYKTVGIWQTMSNGEAVMGSYV